MAQVLSTSPDAIEREIEKLKKSQVLPRPVNGMIKIEKKREEILEEYLVAVLLQNEEPQRLLETLDIFLKEYKWHLPVLEKLVERLLVYCKAHAVFSGKEFVTGLPQELLPAFDSCFLLPIPKFESIKIAQEEVVKVTKELYERYIKMQIKEIGENIKQNEKDGAIDSISILEDKLTHFVSLLGKKS